MFKLWAKEFKGNKIICDIVITDIDMEKNRTRKIFDAIDEVCYEFDLSKPIWLDKNIEEFKRVDKTRFYQDNFIDSIEFDYLEIQVIEEYWENKKIKCRRGYNVENLCRRKQKI